MAVEWQGDHRLLAQVFLPGRPATDYTARVIRRCSGVAIPLEEELDWIEIASGQNEQ